MVRRVEKKVSVRERKQDLLIGMERKDVPSDRP
jgi:hypothetical protein